MVFKSTFACTLALLLSFSFISAQKSYNFEPSPEHPFGLPNPDMPKENLDFAPLIGECDCASIARIDKDTWGDTVRMTWRFKYIMNGMGIQDETLKEDGKHSGSIRQFIADSARWFVHYYSSNVPSTTLSAWEGNKTSNGDIVLYKDQTAPNGMEGNYKITFSDISDEGFNWLGEWVSKDESFSYPTWKIFCNKKKYETNAKEKAAIKKAAAAFSQAYMDGDWEYMAKTYTEDGKIFPGKSDIIEGYEALKDFWTIKNGTEIVLHRVNSKELTIFGDYAYDYGYYGGQSRSADKKNLYNFEGKYVIIWKKVDEKWKMYLDIWSTM